MGGMGSGFSVTSPVIVAAFTAALAHQALIIALMVAGSILAWVAGRQVGDVPARGSRRGPPGGHEPPARRLLRIGFGAMWVCDGALQAQPAMPAGLPTQVIAPAAATSPAWVRHLVAWGATVWSFHPIQAAAAAVWLQFGIGVWMLAAQRGWWSRAAGAASFAWGLLVWVFGEAFGGIFAPGLTWLFGAPGAALLYCAAGAAVALPRSAWTSPRAGRVILRLLGALLAGLAVLQAWPGRGFWEGTARGRPAGLAAMTQIMARTPQPAFLSALIGSFTSFEKTHGLAVNLIVVAGLSIIGLTMIAVPARPAWLRPALVLLILLCLADWVLVQDLGILGGLGTDPNSMIPWALVAIGGYLAVTRPARPVTQPAGPAEALVRPASLREAAAGARAAAVIMASRSPGIRGVLVMAALGMVLAGAVPRPPAAPPARSSRPRSTGRARNSTARRPPSGSPTRTAGQSAWRACAARRSC